MTNDSSPGVQNGRGCDSEAGVGTVSEPCNKNGILAVLRVMASLSQLDEILIGQKSK